MYNILPEANDDVANAIKVVIAMYRFSSDIVKTLPIYYFTLLEYVCEVLKSMIIQNPRKPWMKKKLKNRLNMEFPMLRESWTTFSITVNQYSLPLQSNFFVRLKTVSHFISQNLEAIDHPIPEMKNYNDFHMVFSHKYTGILWQNYMLWHRTRWRKWICVFIIVIDGVFHEF